MESVAPIGMNDDKDKSTPIVVKDDKDKSTLVGVKDVTKNALLNDKPKADIKKDGLRCVCLVTNGRCRNIVSRTSTLQLCEKHEQVYEFVDVD